MSSLPCGCDPELSYFCEQHRKEMAEIARADAAVECRQMKGQDIRLEDGGEGEDAALECKVPPAGWRCTRGVGHDGPCAAIPDSNSLRDSLNDAAGMPDAATQERVLHMIGPGTIAFTLPAPASPLGLPTSDAERKKLPLWTGVIMYFPDALLAVANVSRLGNEQHNPGEPLHWAREKSTDQMNTAVRHMLDHSLGTTKDKDGAYHLAKAIWRLSAELQLTIERDHANAQEEQYVSAGPVPSAAPTIDSIVASIKADAADKDREPRRARYPREQYCPSFIVSRGLSCERPVGHSGKHMAFVDYATRTPYPGGVW